MVLLIITTILIIIIIIIISSFLLLSLKKNYKKWHGTSRSYSTILLKVRDLQEHHSHHERQVSRELHKMYSQLF